MISSCPIKQESDIFDIIWSDKPPIQLVAQFTGIEKDQLNCGIGKRPNEYIYLEANSKTHRYFQEIRVKGYVVTSVKLVSFVNGVATFNLHTAKV